MSDTSDLDLLGTFESDGRSDPPAAGTAPSGYIADVRDWPQPSPGDTREPFADDRVAPPDRLPVVILDPVRVMPAALRIVAAESYVWAAGIAPGDTGVARKYMGLPPSRLQAQAIAYSLWTVTTPGAGDFLGIAAADGALPSSRFRLVSASGAVRLDGVPGAMCWPMRDDTAVTAGIVTVSVLVVGIAA